MVEANNLDSLRSVESNEFLPPVGMFLKLGGFFLVGTVGVGVLLAALIEYPVVVRTSGVVRPKGEVRIVQATFPGTVRKIAVTENQQVQTGEVIALLDSKELQNQRSQILGNIQQKQEQLRQLWAQNQALNSQIVAESDRNNRAVASAKAQLEVTQQDYEEKQVNASSNVEEAKANIKVAQKELEKAQAELKSVESQLIATEAALQGAMLKLERYKTIAESGSISQNQLEEAQLAVTQQRQILASQKALVEAQKQVVEKQKQEIEAAKAREKRAIAGLNPSKAQVSIAAEKIAQERAQKEVNLAKLKQEQESLIQQQAALEDQFHNAKKDLKQIELDLTKTAIRTTEAGTILKLEIRNSGQVVNKGDAIAQIAPQEVPLVIKTKVAAKDIAKVEICQEKLVQDCTQGQVGLRISAYPYPDYGSLRGAVRSISPDAISQNNDTNLYYEVTIQPLKNYLEKNSQTLPLQSGMEVRSDIISRRETVIKFIFRKIMNG